LFPRFNQSTGFQLDVFGAVSPLAAIHFTTKYYTSKYVVSKKEPISSLPNVTCNMESQSYLPTLLISSDKCQLCPELIPANSCHSISTSSLCKKYVTCSSTFRV